MLHKELCLIPDVNLSMYFWNVFSILSCFVVLWLCICLSLSSLWSKIISLLDSVFVLYDYTRIFFWILSLFCTNVQEFSFDFYRFCTNVQEFSFEFCCVLHKCARIFFWILCYVLCVLFELSPLFLLSSARILQNFFGVARHSPICDLDYICLLQKICLVFLCIGIELL